MNAALEEMVDAFEPEERDRWDALVAGRISFQRCTFCAHAWLPARPECPSCLGAEWEWEEASGSGRLVSWVVYRRAFHPAFEGQGDYAIALVELDEGPLIVARMQSVLDGFTPECDQAVVITVIDVDGVNLFDARSTELRPSQKTSR